MPLEMMVLSGYRLPDVNHLGAGVRLLEIVGQGHRVELSRLELSPRNTQLGYFQVIAEPVSTWVQEIFERSAAAITALGDEVVNAALTPFSSPGTSSAPLST